MELLMRKVTVVEFNFAKEPEFTPRTPYWYMTYEELEGIKNFPYILDFDCSFTMVVKVGDEEYTLSAVIPKGFTYNLADIPPFLQILSYDRHSPFVKNASFIHDYMTSRKAVLWEDWELKKLGITPLEFKRITSEVFCHVLKYNAVPYGKAHLMAWFMDLWQYTVPSWYALGKTETSL